MVKLLNHLGDQQDRKHGQPWTAFQKKEHITSLVAPKEHSPFLGNSAHPSGGLDQNS
jgi:hypothetical protein